MLMVGLADLRLAFLALLWGGFRLQVRLRGEVHRLVAPRDSKNQSNFVEVSERSLCELCEWGRVREDCVSGHGWAREQGEGGGNELKRGSTGLTTSFLLPDLLHGVESYPMSGGIPNRSLAG